MAELTEKFASSGGKVIYRGWAYPGTATSSSKWRIVKYIYSGNDVTDKRYPNGDNRRVYVWNSRASYTYPT